MWKGRTFRDLFIPLRSKMGWRCVLFFSCIRKKVEKKHCSVYEGHDRDGPLVQKCNYLTPG